MREEQEKDLRATAESAKAAEIADPDTPIVSDGEVDDAIDLVARIIRRVKDSFPPPFNYIADGALTLLEVFVKPRETPIGHTGSSEEGGGGGEE